MMLRHQTQHLGFHEFFEQLVQSIGCSQRRYISPLWVRGSSISHLGLRILQATMWNHVVYYGGNATCHQEGHCSQSFYSVSMWHILFIDHGTSHFQNMLILA